MRARDSLPVFLCMHLLALNRCFGLLIVLEFVLRRRRENKLASDLICSRFRLTFDWPGSPCSVCGDTEELPELLKLGPQVIVRPLALQTDVFVEIIYSCLFLCHVLFVILHCKFYWIICLCAGKTQLEHLQSLLRKSYVILWAKRETQAEVCPVKTKIQCNFAYAWLHMAHNPAHINNHNTQPPFVCLEANGRNELFPLSP